MSNIENLRFGVKLSRLTELHDLTDNVFEKPIGRFAKIEEDCAPLHLLVSDYEHWLKGA